MEDPSKQTQKLLEESAFLKQRIEDLEASKSKSDQFEEALRSAEAFLNGIIEHSPHAMWISDSRGTLVRLNQACRDLLCITDDEVVGKYNVLEDTLVVEQGYLPLVKQVFEKGKNAKFIIRYDTARLKNLALKKQASVVLDVTITPIQDRAGRVIHAIIQHIDITGRERAEEALSKSEEKFRTIFDRVGDGILVADPVTKKFIEGNATICSMLGYTKEEILTLTVLDIHPPKDIRRVLDDFEQMAKGEKALAGDLPVLRKDGSIFHADISAAPTMIGETPYIIGVFRDITERKRAEEKLQNTLEELRKALNTTIQVMVSAVETRDPYTSGHQTRSADLARAIATEMGLSQEKIDAIRIAGSIHDIGKLSIPAEILSKPSKLLELEFSLIKEHTRMGYEILKDVQSPWPLAEIVYQHHERMDGSGYPRNLKGEDIRIEARVLAVADVIEAMASHRPYRAGFSIDIALAEIEKNRGIFYDADAVDACLRLFREKGFHLAGN